MVPWTPLVVGLLLIPAAPAAGAPASDQPDLVPELRSAPYEGQVAPVYVDAYERPGRILYRFDMIIRNQGGALDLYRDANTGAAMQAVWRGGVPSETPDPNRPPTSSDATSIDIGSRGAAFAYVFEKTHNHWHFSTAAQYELELPGGSSRGSEKVGFCLLDGFGDTGAVQYFPRYYMGSGEQTWCGFDHPDGNFVRMGISPGAADRYASQRELQWIDITGLRPGSYALEVSVNPLRHLEESSALNNVVRETRSIPGVIAADVGGEQIPGAPVTLPLEASVVAPEVPARASGSCEPTATSAACYVSASAGGPLSFRIVRGPAHGSAAVIKQSGTSATARYEPAPDYAGEDSFTYTATDARGLISREATASIAPAAEIPGGTGGEPAPGGAGGEPAPGDPPGNASSTGRLVAILAVRSRRGRWYAIVRVRERAVLSGRLQRRRGRRYSAVRRIRARTLSPGRRRIPLGGLEAGGRYRLLLAARGAERTERLATRFRARR